MSTLAELDEVVTASTVAGYWPSGDELDLIALWHRLVSGGTEVLLPRIDPGGAPSMEFVRWDPTAQLLANRFGIREPTGEAVALDSIDVFVLPCVAIDDTGTRVGMGAGFYDRTLQGLRSGSRGVLVAVAFESQRVADPQRILRRDWDVPADVVVTESVVLRLQQTEPGT